MTTCMFYPTILKKVLQSQILCQLFRKHAYPSLICSLLPPPRSTVSKSETTGLFDWGTCLAQNKPRPSVDRQKSYCTTIHAILSAWNLCCRDVRACAIYKLSTAQKAWLTKFHNISWTFLSQKCPLCDPSSLWDIHTSATYCQRHISGGLIDKMFGTVALINFIEIRKY